MLKGVQKNFIMVKLPRSLHFEEAYFLMRSPQKNSHEGEMIKEANRILKNNIIGGYFFREERPSKKQKTFKIQRFV